MKSFELHLYTVDIIFIRNLSNTDNNVLSVSPQIGKSFRPFLGIVVLLNGRKYCIPLSSPKDKYRVKSKPDFIKVVDKRIKDKNGVPKYHIIYTVHNTRNVFSIN